MVEQPLGVGAHVPPRMKQPAQSELFARPVTPLPGFSLIDSAPHRTTLLVRAGASAYFASTWDGRRWFSTTGGSQTEVRPTHFLPETILSGGQSGEGEEVCARLSRGRMSPAEPPPAQKPFGRPASAGTSCRELLPAVGTNGQPDPSGEISFAAKMRALAISRAAGDGVSLSRPGVRHPKPPSFEPRA